MGAREDGSDAAARLRAAACAGLEAALDLALRHAPAARRHLAPLEGKILALAIRGLEVTVYFTADHDRIEVRPAVATPPDAVLRGAPVTLMRGAVAAGPFPAGVEVSGDVETAQRFKELFDAIDIDWEEELSGLVGDVVAHQLGAAGRGVRDWTRQAARSLEQDLGEYLREEAGLAPQRVEVEEFLAAVDTARAAAERLEQRVARLERRARDTAPHKRPRKGRSVPGGEQ